MEGRQAPKKPRPRKSAVKITKRVVDAAHYDRKTGAQYVWDSLLTGFGLRLYPSGRKVYIVAYRAAGVQRFLTLGRHGELTPDQARDLAAEVLLRVRQGGDPSEERQAYREAPTMADLAERYMEEHARPHKKPSSILNDKLAWKNHILPALGRRKVADVTREEIARFHRSKVKMPYGANRVLALLSNAFKLAEMWGWRPDSSNPCRHVQRFREKKRQRFLSGEELNRLATVLAEIEHERTEPAAPIAAIRLLLFTGCRMGEILQLRWSEVDFERRCLFLADSKTGSKVVHLNSPALEVLAGIERDKDNPYVIRGRIAGTHWINLQLPWGRIRRQAGLEDVRIHDLRHSFASVAAGAGLSLPMIGRLLGHTRADTTLRYAHLADNPLRQATEQIGASIEAAMQPRPMAIVVPIAR
jgi:integrase